MSDEADTQQAPEADEAAVSAPAADVPASEAQVAAALPAKAGKKIAAAAASGSAEDDADGDGSDADEDGSDADDADEDGSDADGSDDDEQDGLDEIDVKDLLRSALKAPPARTSVIRRGVQERIRNESRGRFFADGWSRNSAPKTTFLVTTLLMLLLTLLAWALLSPIGVEVFGG